MARAWIGTSGFTYPHWRGPFYPPGLPQARWFDHYVQHFNSLELNVTFYRLPRPAAFEAWARRAPRDFRFTLKGSRFITHVRRLQAARGAVELLLTAAEPLGDRLACLLWQLPPGFRANPGRLRAFLADLEGLGPARPCRHAFEFRHPSWFNDEVFTILAKASAAVVLADAPFQVLPPGARGPRLGRPIVRAPLTADWAYVRRHGPGAMFASDYPPAMVRADARWMARQLEEGRDVFAFYNNDVEGHAVRNAKMLARLLGSDPRARGRRPA